MTRQFDNRKIFMIAWWYVFLFQAWWVEAEKGGGDERKKEEKSKQIKGKRSMKTDKWKQFYRSRKMEKDKQKLINGTNEWKWINGTPKMFVPSTKHAKWSRASPAKFLQILRKNLVNAQSETVFWVTSFWPKTLQIGFDKSLFG